MTDICVLTDNGMDKAIHIYGVMNGQINGKMDARKWEVCKDKPISGQMGFWIY